MNLDGSGIKKVTDFVPVYNPETGYYSTPAGSSPGEKELSPDGNSIVYAGALGSDGQSYTTGVYTLPVSGGTPKQVAVPSPGKDSALSLVSPHYNHDGSKVMYYQGWKLYSVSAADGKNKRLLLDNSEQWQTGNWGIITK